MRVWSVGAGEQVSHATGTPRAGPFHQQYQYPIMCGRLFLTLSLHRDEQTKTPNTSAGIQIHCSDGRPAPGCLSVLYDCRRRSATLLTLRLRWRSDSCNSLECIRVFPVDALLSVFKTHFVVFWSGFRVLNSFFFWFSWGLNVSTYCTVFFALFSICWAPIHGFFLKLHLPFWNKISFIHSRSHFFMLWRVVYDVLLSLFIYKLSKCTNIEEIWNRMLNNHNKFVFFSLWLYKKLLRKYWPTFQNICCS